MKNLFIGLISAMLISSTIGFVLAQPNTTRVPATNEKSDVIVTIPVNAVEVTDDVFSLGTATDVDGREVQGFMIIDRGQGTHKPNHPSNPGGNGGTTSTCFAFLANGAKWKSIEPWVVNPNNTEGLGDSFVFTNLAGSIQKWEDAAVANILGDGSTTIVTLTADTVSPDGVNEVYFGDVGSPGAIAVTVVWGVFGGPPSQRKLVEWDQVYDQVDFNWSATGEAGKMDFENINAHELGHSDGMGHPDDSCTEETMYRFAGFGETKKRTLNAGDIAGIQALY